MFFTVVVSLNPIQILLSYITLYNSDNCPFRVFFNYCYCCGVILRRSSYRQLIGLVDGDWLLDDYGDYYYYDDGNIWQYCLELLLYLCMSPTMIFFYRYSIYAVNSYSASYCRWLYNFLRFRIEWRSYSPWSFLDIDPFW